MRGEGWTQELARQLEEEGEAGVSTSAEQPSGPAFISWRGQSFPVRANRVRASLQVGLPLCLVQVLSLLIAYNCT